MIIKDCKFAGVEFSADALEAIQAIAQGVTKGMGVLGDLAQVLRASNVHVDTMLRFEGPWAEGGDDAATDHPAQ